MRLTLPSVSDEIITWSTAASVPTRSTERLTRSSLTTSTLIAFAAWSRPRAWAVSLFEHAAAPAATTPTAVNPDNKRKTDLRIGI